MMPVETTLETALPEIEPNRLEPTMAIFDEPPRNRPHQPGRNIGEEARAARRLEQEAEEHEGEDDGGRHLHREAEHAVGVEHYIDRQPVDRHILALQPAGDQMPDQGEDQEEQQEGEQDGAGCPAQTFDNGGEEDSGRRHGIRRVVGEIVQDGRVFDRHIERGRGRSGGDDQVVPGHTGPRCPFAGGYGEIQRRQPDREHGGVELLVHEDEVDRAVQVRRPEQGAERQQGA